MSLLAMGAAGPLRAESPRFSADPPSKPSDHGHAELPSIPLQIGQQRVTAEVAADDAARSRGLMFRQSLAPDHGMLFVFPEPQQYCFWMKNTPLPLSIAFIDPNGAIVNLANMQPLSLDTHCAIGPALYALEMEQGWFARHGIRPGDSVQGLPRRALPLSLPHQ